MAAADISNLGSHGPGSADANAGSGAGPGQGPGGARLYKAEWYRRPTRGEIDYYLPKTSIAAAGAESDAGRSLIITSRIAISSAIAVGSGLARAMRKASWQFLVRPPNIDGKPLVGSWVRIQFDFNDNERN